MTVDVADGVREHLEETGYVVVEDAIVGEELARLQEAFNRFSDEARPGWLEQVAQGRGSSAFFDVGGSLEKDDVFLGLVDHPSFFPILMDATGGELLFLFPQVRTVPVSPVSYVGWHSDMPHTNPLHLKVQIYVNDVPADRGPFAYIPQSHKPGAGPYPSVKKLDHMPGHRPLPGKAGTAIVFNGYGWHTSMVNRTPVPRKSIILIYEKWNEARWDPEQWQGIEEKLTTPERRKLFGIER